MKNITRWVTHSEFLSTKFSRSYLWGWITAIVQKTTLNQTSDIFWELEDCITNVVNFVNENDRWTVVRWYKRGSMKDCLLIEAQIIIIQVKKMKILLQESSTCILLSYY